MGKVSKYPISDAVYERISELLLIVVSESFGKNDAREFLDAFFSPAEKVIFGKRLAIAVLLAKQYSYSEIQHVLHVSKPTIAHVKHNFAYRKKGYSRFVEKILRNEQMNSFWEQVEDIVFNTLSTGKGSGGWRYLHTEIKKYRRKKQTQI